MPPLVIQDKTLMRQWTRAARARGERVGLIPTMGALHAGHLTLVELAAAHADRLVVSIYVNPAQFDRAEDLAKYPRMLAADVAALAGTKCDVVFAPSDMYLGGHATWVEVAGLTEHLCGAMRPGHFRGVATVVSKLLNVVEPDVAVFGNKDYQQRRVLERMVRDLDMAIEVLPAPTVREADGLAMSSRNLRLDADARARAVAIPRALEAAHVSFQGGERLVGVLAGRVRAALTAAGGRIDYVEIADDATLVPHADSTLITAPSVLAVAVFFGGIRLIDNQVLAP